MSKALIFFTDVVTELVRQFGELFLSAEELAGINEKLNFADGYEEAGKAFEQLKEKYKGNSEEIKKYAKELADSQGWEVARLESQLQGLLQLSEMDPLALWTETGQTMDQVERQIKSIGTQLGLAKGFVTGMDEALTEFNKNQDEAAERAPEERSMWILGEDTRGVIQELERLQKIYETFQKTDKDPINAEGFQNTIDIIKGLIDILQGDDVAGKTAKDGLKDWTKGIGEEIKKMAFEMEAAGIPIENHGERMKRLAQLIGQAQNDIDNLQFGFIDSLAGLGMSVVDSVAEMRLQKIDEEMDKLQERYDLQKELLDLEEGDEEAKQERLRQMDKEKALREKKLREEQEKVERRAFLFQQAVQAGTIIAEAAKGIAVATATYGSNPFTAPLLPGIIGLIKGTAAVQLGTVLAQSIPAFKDGHLAGTHEGMALINDGGQVEVVERRDGTIQATPQMNTLIGMDRGDKVHKSIDDFLATKNYMNHLLGASTYAGGNINSYGGAVREALGIKEEIRDGFKNLSIKNDNSNVGRVVADAIRDNQYENRFL
jgi:hypothetical protein